jgi:hypothetical protein
MNRPHIAHSAKEHAVIGQYDINRYKILYRDPGDVLHCTFRDIHSSLKKQFTISENLYAAYEALINTGIVKNTEIRVLSAWLKDLEPTIK